MSALRPLLISFAVLAPTAAAGETKPIDTFVSSFGDTVYTGPGIGLSTFGPDAGEPIVGADLTVVFDANGATLASDLLLVYTLPLAEGTAQWVVTGADLGFPAAHGQFTGSLSTDLFDGVVVNDSPFPFTPLEVSVQSVSGPIFGTMVQQDFELHTGPRMTADVGSVQVASGGSQTFALTAGPNQGPGKFGLMVGSLSGTAPGLMLGDICVPLAPDAYTAFLLQAGSNGPISALIAPLGSDGTRTAVLSLPPLPASVAGTTMNHAFLLIDPSLELLSASNAVDLQLLP